MIFLLNIAAALPAILLALLVANWIAATVAAWIEKRPE